MKNHFSLDELLKLHSICVGNSINQQIHQRELNELSTNEYLTDSQRENYRVRAEGLNEVIAEVDALSKKVWQLILNYSEL